MPFIKREPQNGKKRGEKPPPARRVILRDERTAGFPLPHDFFFRQHERNCENFTNNFCAAESRAFR